MKITTRILAGLMAALVLAPAATAQPKAIPQPVVTLLEARKVLTAADGKETLATAEAARPGDVIEYTATYRNTGREAVTNLVATLPIPANTELLAGSTRPAGARASLDGQRYGDVPLKRTVKRDGRDVEEAVPLREYRSLRWSAGTLGPDRTLAFIARVRVVDDRPAGEPAAKKAGAK